MKTFTDLSNQQWTLALSIDVAKRIKELAGIDLMVVISGGAKAQDLFCDMSTDLYTLGSVLWAMCKPQADSRQVNEEQFAAGLADGVLLRAAASALTDEVVDFFDKFRGTTVLRKALEKMRGARDRINDKGMEKLETMELKLNEVVNKFGEESGPPPADSESTPDLLPSANSA